MRMVECDCGQVIRGKTDDEVMKNGMNHAKQYHPGMKVTDEMLRMMQSKIRDE